MAWNFSGECQESFQKLKDTFTSAPILSHWNPKAQVIVETDALDYAISAILSVVDSNGEVHPMAFYSCSLMQWS